MTESISVYMQVYKRQRAVFEALKSFRTFYQDVPITIVCDDGDDFSAIAQAFDASYTHSDFRAVTGSDLRTGNLWTLEGIYELFKRIYQHCLTVDTDWVLFLTSGTRTLRRIRSFPQVPIVGARTNPFSPQLTDYLMDRYGGGPYVYGTAGGGMVRRQEWIHAYENNRDLSSFLELDPGVALYSDLAMGLFMFVNGFEYAVWEEVSEIFHETAPIIRDSAFDHAYKHWYETDWDERLLKAFRYTNVKEFDENLLAT